MIGSQRYLSLMWILSPIVFAMAVSPLSAADAQSATTTAPAYKDKNPQRYDLSKRASQIDKRAKEHPELGFIFQDAKGKVTDLQHAVVDTSVTPRGQLVIWLMGHNQGLFERISSYGLHGIQVHYANGWYGKLDPKDRDDGTSLGKIRLEAATGIDQTSLVDIPQPDSIMERSRQFVIWLDKEHPQGNWSQFLTADRKDLRWDKVILSGISHGSTTAGRFAMHQEVARVVMFSGPRDQFDEWQGFPSKTPANRYFGFTHVLDTGWVGDHYCRSWEMLGLHQFGPLVNVEQSQPPYGNSRRLITDADVKNDANRAHSGVVPGGGAMKDSTGKLLHENVWRYLFTHPVDETGSPVPADPSCKKDLR